MTGSAQVQTLLAQALRQHQAGRLAQAAKLYQDVLIREPENAEALNLLGMLAMQTGQHQGGLELMRRAIAADGRQAAFHFNLGVALQTTGALEDAIASYRRALVLKPGDAETCNNLGSALATLGRLDEAEAALRKALATFPGNPDTLNNLGNVLRAGSDLPAAIDCFERALAAAPGHAAAHSGLGGALWNLGRRDEAIASYQRAIALNPDLVEALANLGMALSEQGQLDQADALYRRALALGPPGPSLLNEFAALALARGDGDTALEAITHSLAADETPRAKKLFVDLAVGADWRDSHPQAQHLLTRALSQAWDRPGRLSLSAARLVKRNPAIAPLVARANQAWPERLGLADLLGADGFAPLAHDSLLMALLTSAPNTDMELERFLTLARATLMDDDNDDAARGFGAALAQQCYINEYVFLAGDSEARDAQALRDRLVAKLASGETIAPLMLLTVAAYFPLHTLAHAQKLTEREWPAVIETVLTQQLREPMEERRLAAAIPRLTPIRDDVSLLVRSQYEQNPYPRWVRAPAAKGTQDVTGFLQRKFPHAAIESPGRMMKDFLVAGCGTGQQSISRAQIFGDHTMLAVDLSLTSLAYAKRKSTEYGLQIEYGQADILELDALDRGFDVVEAIGVLHHMKDPWAGWTSLLSRLRPQGFMRIGLYSQTARRAVSEARARITEQGLESSVDGIRRFRHALADGMFGDRFDTVLTSEDFFSVSACRDLLFHAQEHQLTLLDIAGFIARNGLNFLGFELDGAVHQAYRERFGQDPAAIDLANWDSFEAENPSTFADLYVFWIQKP